MLPTSTRRFAVAIAIAAASWSCSANSASAPDVAGAGDDALVATVDGRAVTASELDEWIRDDLFEKQTQGNASKLYELRAESIERMANELIVEKQAAAQQLSEDDFLEREVAALGEVSEEDIAAFFQENQARLAGRGDLDTLRPQIRQFLEQDRPSQVMTKLRETADVEITLEPPRIMVATTGPSRGPQDAPITIVEFSDYQCPFCGRVEPVMEDVLNRYPGKVRLVFRHLPLSFHKDARPAAEASVCAENQGLFWEYHALLFQNQKALGGEALQKYAVDAGLNVENFNSCLTEEPTRARVEEDLREAREAGASGTPAFFVNGIPLSGALPAEEFVKIIDEELARLAAEGGSTS